jgi:hypothetical protein
VISSSPVMRGRTLGEAYTPWHRSGSAGLPGRGPCSCATQNDVIVGRSQIGCSATDSVQWLGKEPRIADPRERWGTFAGVGDADLSGRISCSCATQNEDNVGRSQIGCSATDSVQWLGRGPRIEDPRERWGTFAGGGVL